jgi:hypothetical protein
MRKITSLLMLFCAFVCTAWAGPTDLPEITTDLNNPIYYTIYNTRSSQPGGLMYYAGDEVGLKDGCTSVTLEAQYKFFFTGSHEELYIHNAAANGKKLASVDSWTEDGIAWTVSAPTANGLAFGPKGETGNVFWNDKNYSVDGNVSDFTVWSSTDAGSIFVVNRADEWVFPSEGKFYIIECPLFEKVQGEAGKKAIYVNGEGKAVWGAEDITDKNFYWTVSINEGKIALQNLGTGQYLSKADGTMSADKAEGVLRSLGDKNFNIVLDNSVHAAGHNGGANASGTLTGWGGVLGSASAWTFVEKQDPDAAIAVQVVYSITYKGVEKYTQTTETFVGEEWPAVTASIPFGLSATKPEGSIAESDVVAGVANKTIELSENMPFAYAADYASINKWYYIQMHSSGGSYSRYIQAMEDHIEWLDVEMNVSEVDAYTWAFIGNPFDGFKLVNYAAGATKGVNADPTTDPATNPAMGDIESATVWTLKPSRTNPDAQYFCFQYPNNNYYMNAQSGKTAFWTDADQGSTMWVTERDFSGATELQAVIDQVKAFVAAGVADATTVGYITSESVANVAAALAVAEQAVATKTNCLEAQIALEDAVNAVQTIQPEEGKFYTIQNAYSNIYMYVSDEAGLKSVAEPSMASVFTFVKGQNGELYLKNVERGSFTSTAPAHGTGQAVASAFTTENAKAVTIKNLGVANQVSITPYGGATLHHDVMYSNIVGWNAAANSRSAWAIQEVNIEDYAHTVTIGESGYATLVLGYDAVIPAGVKAYAVSATGNDYATLSEVTGVLAAGEAVVLEAAAGDYQFKYTTEVATEVENNLLVGTVFNTNVEANAYMLSSKEGQAGFYKVALDVSTDPSNDETVTEGEGEEATTTIIPTYEAFKNNAFKAYLPVASEAAVLKINFGGNTTAIESVVNGLDVNAPIYDLSGRRVNAAVKGIYIQNGKKFIVK